MYQAIEANLTIGILIGIISSVCLNLGKGVQRIGAETLGKDILKKWKENPEDKHKIIIWLVGTLMTAIAAVSQVGAQLFLTNSSIFVALSGIGIISVVLFAARIIKEKISLIQVIGIIIIIIGTAFLGINYPEITEPIPSVDFVVYSVIVAAIATGLVVYAVKKERGYGIVYGSIAGLFNGFAAICTAFSVSTGNRDFAASILNVWLIGSIALGQCAFWVTQYAFKKGGNASLVVPAMSSFLIIVPFINDVFIYRLPLGPFQYLSFLLNIVGIIVLCVSSAAGLNRVLSAAPTTEKKEEKAEA
jgi:drug/metabolite transporter (DMT)-like permease